MLRRSFAACLAASLLMGAYASTADDPKAEQALQGSWTLSAGEADGKPLTAEQLMAAKLEVKGAEYTVTLAGKETVKGTQKVDPTKEPKTIDITDTTGPNKGKTALGIYELKGDEYRVAFAVPGKPRPTKFAAPADSGQWVHVWKKVK